MQSSVVIENKKAEVTLQRINFHTWKMNWMLVSPTKPTLNPWATAA